MKQHLLGGRERLLRARVMHEVKEVNALLVGSEDLRRDVEGLMRQAISEMDQIWVSAVW